MTLFEAAALREYRKRKRLWRYAPHGFRRRAYERLQDALHNLLREELTHG